MKTFLFTTEFKNASYGQNVITRVYQLKNNTPVYIGETYYNTGSHRGHEHEAMQVIIDNKLLPKNCMDRPKHGYIVREKQDKVFKLVSL